MLDQVLIFAAVIVVGGLILYLQMQMRFGIEEKVDKKIRKELEVLGLEVEDISEADGTGPFPMIEVSLLVTKGLNDRTYYRHVFYKDRKGIRRESWVKMRGVAGFLFDMEWRPALSTNKKAGSF